MKTNPDKWEAIKAKAAAEGSDPYELLQRELEADPKQFRKAKKDAKSKPGQ